MRPEQVQDFYPTPGTLSTAMYYTGLDPRTMQRVYVPRSPSEKAMQRALLQASRPENRALVLRALRQTGRMDLVGYGKGCLIAPERKTAKRSVHTRGPEKGREKTAASSGKSGYKGPFSGGKHSSERDKSISGKKTSHEPRASKRRSAHGRKRD